MSDDDCKSCGHGRLSVGKTPYRCLMCSVKMGQTPVDSVSGVGVRWATREWYPEGSIPVEEEDSQTMRQG